VRSLEPGKNKTAALIRVLLLAVPVMSAGCVLVDYTVPMAGKYDRAGVVVKNFIMIGTVTVQATEKHTISPLGISRKVEGAKVTYSDLMRKAAALNADDIINVRIDMRTTGKTTIAEWLNGWERTFFYTGRALAIKYVDSDENEEQEQTRR